MHAVETSTREAAVARDSTTFHFKHAEYRAALADREALERVSRAEAENAMVLASTHEDAKGLTRKVTLLKDDVAAERQAREASEREH
jgi:hypothetical protein